MSVTRHPRMKARVNILFHNTIVRYLFAVVTVASTLALRIGLTPLTGTGAPFLLFFAAVLVTSMVAGIAARCSDDPMKQGLEPPAEIV